MSNDSLLTELAAEGEPTRPDDFPVLEGHGQIGRHKLLQKLGEGGFGVVYMADQKEPLKRPGGPQDHQAGDGKEK